MFERYQRTEQALVLTLLEMVVNGVSTRKVSRITEEVCGKEFSKSTVSALCQQLDPVVQAWNERRLDAQAFPFVIVDALVSEDGQVCNLSALIASGVNAEGYREIFGMQLGDSESEGSWGQFFGWLKERGLHGVDFLISDDHRGPVKAAQRHFQGVSWQRCQAHCTAQYCGRFAPNRILWSAIGNGAVRCDALLFNQPDVSLMCLRPPAAAAPVQVGIDDFAFHRGHGYGTIVVDLTRHCVLELKSSRNFHDSFHPTDVSC